MPSITRRRALRTLFCSSAALGLNLTLRRSVAQEPVATDALHFLVLGDFGSGDKLQSAVARSMETYARRLKFTPQGLWMLGDNFYKQLKGGVDSERWQSGFEKMYPASAFPGPCWAVLGNHDYHDTVDGEHVQTAYAAKHPGTRWRMTAKYYRVDWPDRKPLVTFLALDTNWRSTNERIHKSSIGKRKPWWMSEEEEAAQDAWLRAELAKPRTAPWLVVAGHHPFYTNGPHGDTKAVVEKWGALLQEHSVHLAMAGHDHDLQHLELEGLKTSFIVSGAGGARVRELKSKRAVPFARDVQGFSHLQINADRLVLRHLDANGKQLHAFSKSPDGKVTLL